MHNQLSEYFDDIFNPFLAAFRKGFGCQSTLLRLLEDWKKALDNHESAAAVLMDLSKAFDCLPHGLLIEKLRAYGMRLKIKFCLFVLYLPTHNLPPYSKNYVAIS